MRERLFYNDTIQEEKDEERKKINEESITPHLLYTFKPGRVRRRERERHCEGGEEEQ